MSESNKILSDESRQKLEQAASKLRQVLGDYNDIDEKLESARQMLEESEAQDSPLDDLSPEGIAKAVQLRNRPLVLREMLHHLTREQRHVRERLRHAVDEAVSEFCLVLQPLVEQSKREAAAALRPWIGDFPVDSFVNSLPKIQALDNYCRGSLFRPPIEPEIGAQRLLSEIARLSKNDVPDILGLLKGD